MGAITIVLAGGPNDLPVTRRVHEIENIEDTVKICFGAGYEHFSYQGEFSNVDGDRLPVFQWCGNTKIAE
jgi:hypothetical protein